MSPKKQARKSARNTAANNQTAPCDHQGERRRPSRRRPGMGCPRMPPAALRRGREYREDQQTPGPAVSHAVGHPLGCNQQVAGTHRQFPAREQEDTLPFEHMVDLVHAMMGVQRMRLPGLERVQSNEKSGRFEDRRLSHSVRTPRRVLRRLNHTGMLHPRILAWAGAGGSMAGPGSENRAYRQPRQCCLSSGIGERPQRLATCRGLLQRACRCPAGWNRRG